MEVICAVCEDTLWNERDIEAHAACVAEDAPAPEALAIRVSRSAIADRQLCEQRRFWGYHWDGTGLAPAVTPASLLVGDATHQWLSRAFALAYVAGEDAALRAAIPGHLVEQAVEVGVEGEDALLAFALAYGWTLARLPQILEEAVVVSTEDEWAFAVAEDIEIPQRMDVILRRRIDGILYTLDFKTLSSWSPDWQEKFSVDLQTLLYTEALEKVLGETAGIQFEGLVKGRKDMLKTGDYAGEPAYGSILVSPYVAKDGSLTPKYTAGLTRRKLTTVEEVVAWIQVLHAQHLEALQNQFPSVPLYLPPPGRRTDVLRPILAAERRFARALPGADHLTFERTPSACLKFGKDHPCPFMELCWGGHAEDPLGSGLFIRKEDHHAE